MSWILVLYFIGTHAVYDLPSKAACERQANLSADLLARSHNVRVDQFSYQCLKQAPITIELVERMTR